MTGGEPVIADPPRSPMPGMLLYGAAHAVITLGLAILAYQVLDTPPWSEVTVFVTFTPGLTQLVTGLPLLWYARRRGRPGAVQGVLIAGLLLALLNAGCWGLVSVAMRDFHG